MKSLLLAAVAAFPLAAPAFAQAAAPPPGAGPTGDKEDRAIPSPTVSVTHHRGMFGGQAVAYTATASETYLKGDDGTPKASIFSVAYVKEPRDPSRPVTFLFNGGGGAAAGWLRGGGGGGGGGGARP